MTLTLLTAFFLNSNTYCRRTLVSENLRIARGPALSQIASSTFKHAEIKLISGSFSSSKAIST